MTIRSFKHIFDEAERHPEFHKELAILEFTEELWRVMQEKGVSGTELGRRIGSSQAYISRVLNGGANFTLGTMTKLAMGLGMELKMHLAPSNAATVWRDVFIMRSRASEAGRSVIKREFTDAPPRALQFAAAPSTPRGSAAITSEEGTDGAAASAA
ncbi:MAG: helix-turn-helix transcriptional regulator [Actinomycetes bacterium]